VLHDAGQVAEPDVDELDVLILDIGQDLVSRAEQRKYLLMRMELGACRRTRALLRH
jgi:hypothetical protein